METPNETLYLNNLNDRIKPDALKRALIPLFGRFGKIVDLIAMKSLWRRGQAFVVYESAEISIKAKASLDGHQLFGKPMRIDFAKSTSDATLKRKNLPITRERKPKITAEESAAKLAERTKAADFFSTAAVAPKVPLYTSLPNRTLFIENLSPDLSPTDLDSLFRNFEGFEESRTIPSRAVAFVDFSFDYQAARAMQAINAKEMAPGYTLRVSYAKR